jgi:hypothetical protein
MTVCRTESKKKWSQKQQQQQWLKNPTFLPWLKVSVYGNGGCDIE